MKAARAKVPPARRRPMPPPEVGDGLLFAPAHALAEWVQAEILAEDGLLHNEDHAHLIDADIGMLWAGTGYISKGRRVAGTAEEVAFRCNAWQRGRQEQQMLQWFQRVPAFLITLDASYARACGDTEFCALVEHELYHIAHARDEFGGLRYRKDGRPALEIRGHDVEEFVGVVRRYGVGDPGGAIAHLARAAGAVPEVDRSQIAGACGACILRAA